MRKKDKNSAESFGEGDIIVFGVRVFKSLYCTCVLAYQVTIDYGNPVGFSKQDVFRDSLPLSNFG